MSINLSANELRCAINHILEIVNNAKRCPKSLDCSTSSLYLHKSCFDLIKTIVSNTENAIN